MEHGLDRLSRISIRRQPICSGIMLLIPENPADQEICVPCRNAPSLPFDAAAES